MDDLISRQAAIDEIKAVYEWHDYITIERLIEHIRKLPSAQPYTEAEIQKMQDLEQAKLQKAYECGRASAQPERKTGKWSVEFSPAYMGGAYCECSQCNYKFAMGAYFEPDEWKYCPNCGADMRGEQDG